MYLKRKKDNERADRKRISLRKEAPLVFILEDDPIQRESLQKNICSFFETFQKIEGVPSPLDIETFSSYHQALDRLQEPKLKERDIIGILDYDLSRGEDLESRRPSTTLIHKLMDGKNYDPRLQMGIIYSSKAMDFYTDPIITRWEGDSRNRYQKMHVPLLLWHHKTSATKISKDATMMGQIISYLGIQMTKDNYEEKLTELVGVSNKVQNRLPDFGRILSERSKKGLN